MEQNQTNKNNKDVNSHGKPCCFTWEWTLERRGFIMDQKKGQTNEDRYNFDYFDKMNQKEAQKRETKQAPSAGRKEPQKQQRKAAKQKENRQPKQAKQHPQPTGGKQLPAKAARPPQKQQPQTKQPKPQQNRHPRAIRCRKSRRNISARRNESVW